MKCTRCKDVEGDIPCFYCDNTSFVLWKHNMLNPAVRRARSDERNIRAELDWEDEK